MAKKPADLLFGVDDKPPVRICILLDLTDPTVTMTVRFDEYHLDIRFPYQVAPVEFPMERPDTMELRPDPKAVARQAGYLVQQYADKVTMIQDGEQCIVDLHFNH